MDQLEKVLQAENEKLRAENELMRSIATAEGFYNYFFKVLLKFKTREDAFNHLNELYYKLFGCYRYSSYDSFRKLNRKK